MCLVILSGVGLLTWLAGSGGGGVRRRGGAMKYGWADGLVFVQLGGEVIRIRCLSRGHHMISLVLLTLTTSRDEEPQCNDGR